MGAGWFDRRWRVPRAFGHLEIEVYPDAVDAAMREASVRELRGLVYDCRNGQPEARRVLLGVYRSLRGNAAAGGAFGTTPGWRDRIGEELLQAARSGVLLARAVQRRTVTVPIDAPSEAALGPDSSQEPPPQSKTWVGIVLVDQNGTPVPNRPYRIIPPDGTTRDGTLDSNGSAIIQGLDPGSCQIWCPYVAPHPSSTYTVKDGDHTSGVAQANGFDDYTVVWSDPGNSDLQSQRPDPHVLQPGDALTIPEITAQPAANKPTGAKHQFTLQITPLKVRIKMLDLTAKPVTGAQVTLGGTALTTDGTGLVETDIDKSAQSIPVQSSDAIFTIAVGSINPNDDTSDAGYKARLFNLGFLWDPTVGDTDDEMVIALQDFQAQYSLTISGELDDATQSQLAQTYGC